MSEESRPRFPSLATHGATLAARTHGPETDAEPHSGQTTLRERIAMYGFHADLVSVHTGKRTRSAFGPDFRVGDAGGCARLVTHPNTPTL